jgi:predicted O-methyltransferase YrrM
MTMIQPAAPPATLEGLYDQYRAGKTAIAPHLPRLRALAAQCANAVEFGVKQGASSTALLLGAEHVTSLDIRETPQARALQRLVGERWTYRIADTRQVTPQATDLLFIDSLHTYDQVAAELARHADHVRRFLVFHDTVTFGSIGAKGEGGEQAWTYQRGVSVPLEALGIRPAIDALMMRDTSWRIVAHYVDSHGLLVLERR